MSEEKTVEVDLNIMALERKINIKITSFDASEIHLNLALGIIL